MTVTQEGLILQRARRSWNLGFTVTVPQQSGLLRPSPAHCRPALLACVLLSTNTLSSFHKGFQKDGRQNANPWWKEANFPSPVGSKATSPVRRITDSGSLLSVPEHVQGRETHLLSLHVTFASSRPPKVPGAQLSPCMLSAFQKRAGATL